MSTGSEDVAVGGWRSAESVPRDKYVLIAVRTNLAKPKPQWNVSIARKPSAKGNWRNVYGVEITKDILGWRPLMESPI